MSFFDKINRKVGAGQPALNPPDGTTYEAISGRSAPEPTFAEETRPIPEALVLVGALPLNFIGMPFDVWAAPEIAEILRIAKADHLSLVDYNKGYAGLAALVNKVLGNGERTLPPVLLLDPRAPGTSFMVPVLEKYALVVKGVF